MVDVRENIVLSIKTIFDNDGFKDLNRSMKNTRIEIIGLIFFTKLLQVAFRSLLQPAFTLVGVFDLWRIILGVFFLPASLKVLKWSLEFKEALDTLSPSTQNLINDLALFATAFLSAFLGLRLLRSALQGMGLDFDFILGIIGVFSKIISAIFSPLGLLLIGIAAGIVIAWEENFMGMKDIIKGIVESIEWIGGGLIEFFTGLFDAFIALIKGDSEGFIDGIVRLISGIGLFVKGVFLTFGGIVSAIVVGVTRVVIGIFNTVSGVIEDISTGIANFFTEIITSAWNWGVDLVKSIAKGISNTAADIINAVGDIIDDVKNFFGDVGERALNFLGVKTFDDFIIRPGQAPIAINPNDTVVGFKGKSPTGGVTVENTFNVTVSDRFEFERMLDDFSRNQADELRRLVNLPV